MYTMLAFSTTTTLGKTIELSPRRLRLRLIFFTNWLSKERRDLSIYLPMVDGEFNEACEMMLSWLVPRNRFITIGCR